MTDTDHRLTVTLARLAIAQTGIFELCDVLTYAEGFGLVTGSLGVLVDPLALVRRIVDDTVTGRRPWHATARTFAAHLKIGIQRELVERLTCVAETRGRDARLSVVQVGDLPGAIKAAHFTGELMPAFRSNDDAVMTAAMDLNDFVRAQLQQIVRRADEEITAPIVRFESTAIDLDDPDRGSN